VPVTWKGFIILFFSARRKILPTLPMHARNGSCHGVGKRHRGQKTLGCGPNFSIEGNAKTFADIPWSVRGSEQEL
jgi:hypothetical protein